MRLLSSPHRTVASTRFAYPQLFLLQASRSFISDRSVHAPCAGRILRSCTLGATGKVLGSARMYYVREASGAIPCSDCVWRAAWGAPALQIRRTLHAAQRARGAIGDLLHCMEGESLPTGGYAGPPRPPPAHGC